MGRKKNVFTSAVSEFESKLSDFNHYRGFVQWQLGKARAAVEQSLATFQTMGWNTNSYLAAHRLSIVNLLDERRMLIPAPGRMTQGNEVLLMSSEMERRFNSFLLVSAFEEFEEFLKRMLAKLLYQFRSTAVLRQKKDFHRRNATIKVKKGTPHYFETYARWACRRDCKEALREFAIQLDLRRLRKPPVFEMSFDETVHAVGFCRHCIVHAGARIADADLKKIGPAGQSFVAACSHKSIDRNEVLILPASNVIDALFEGLLSLGSALYVLLSERCNMKDELQHFQRT